MKTTFLKLENPCSEQWENMTPTEQGSYCDRCAKNVVDFTRLSPAEISVILKQSGNSLCARATGEQLRTPLPVVDNRLEFSLPLSKIAAGLAIATSIGIGQGLQAQHPVVPTEVVRSADPDTPQKQDRSPQKHKKLPSGDTILFRGTVVAADGERPIENAKITFVTTTTLISSYSTQDGSFTLPIPSDLVDDDNVFRVTYWEIDRKKEGKKFHGYESHDCILSEKELGDRFDITPILDTSYCGGFRGVYRNRAEPIVLDNGVEIPFQEFSKALHGKKSTCTLKHKEYFYFESQAAVAIYGPKAKDGLYLLIDQSEL